METVPNIQVVAIQIQISEWKGAHLEWKLSAMQLNCSEHFLGLGTKR